MNDCGFEQYIRRAGRCHLVGIGGVSMSPLAELLHDRGVNVTGSDMNDGPTVARLRKKGIEVQVGHSAENVSGADFIIRTAAARDDNVEIACARAQGIPVFERAQAWGWIMRGYQNAVCVAGVHGKTTTTSMLTHILLAAQCDPTVMIGGTLPALGSGYRIGEGDTIVLESCEYYNSYLNFFPTIAVVLNVELDHIDFFANLDAVKDSFRQFAALVPQDGAIVCNGDDTNTMDALAPLGRELFTFGFGDDSFLRVRGAVVNPIGHNPSMRVLYDGEPFCDITLGVPGMHNLKNALAAVAAAITLGIPAVAIEEGLAGFVGAGRRFEYKGSFNGAHIYDDYAHHPSELKALLDAVLPLSYNRVILAFQPHTFTRTNAMFDEFAEQLSRADITYLAQIFSAREKNEIGITSADLAAAIPGAQSFPTLQMLAEAVAAQAREGDIILTVGAGDIFKVGEQLADAHNES